MEAVSEKLQLTDAEILRLRAAILQLHRTNADGSYRPG